MIDERLETQASLYVLGALPPDELREFEATLRSDLELQLLVRELRGTAGAMVTAFPRVAPPPALKQRILAAVGEREGGAPNVVPLDERAPSWMGWVPWALAACFAILCVALISIGKTLRQHAGELTVQLEEKNQQTADLHQQVEELQSRVSQQTTNYRDRLFQVQTQLVQRVEEIIRQSASITNQLQQQLADTRRQMVVYRDRVGGLENTNRALQDALTTLGTTDHFANARIAALRPTPNGPAGAAGAALWSAQDQRGLLVLENLPPLPAGQGYQLWLIDPKLAIPVSAGVIPANAAGSRLPIVTQFRVDLVDRFAITIEPQGGSQTPTGRMVLVSGN